MAFAIHLHSCIGYDEDLSRTIQGIVIAGCYVLLKYVAAPGSLRATNELSCKCCPFYSVGVQMHILRHEFVRFNHLQSE